MAIRVAVVHKEVEHRAATLEPWCTKHDVFKTFDSCSRNYITLIWDLCYISGATRLITDILTVSGIYMYLSVLFTLQMSSHLRMALHHGL